ncbi:SufS family cysteine desulfurase [Candidatus Peregrinibacteria bacterium]|nr:SufS family cysteine desulfurase [Candidatus Peregrinibacteria bacterium]
MDQVKKLRNDFPILKGKLIGRPLIYLDNAATTQKPNQVISKLCEFYENYNSNIHRAVYAISEEATIAYEQVRTKIADFLKAEDPAEIIFTRGTTESINLIAYSYGEKNIKKGDEIVVSDLEHHSNFLPWKALCERKGAKLKVLESDEKGDFVNIKDVIGKKTKLIAVTLMSNAIGLIPNLKEVFEAGKKAGAKILLDGAQYVPHFGFSLEETDPDFLVFSGHKMLGPMGVGVLYVKMETLEEMDPFLYGGEMVTEVTEKDVTWNDLPYKFEAGTPSVADVISFGAALDYLDKIDMTEMQNHINDLTEYAFKQLNKIDEISIVSPDNTDINGGVIAFNVDDVHPHDVGTILDKEGIAVRTGHHCAQPLMNKLGLTGTVRISFYLYNTKEEIEILVNALKKVQEIFFNEE